MSLPNITRIRRPLIPSTTPRCQGKNGDPLCLRCARRAQHEADNPHHWYPQIQQRPVAGRCDDHIPMPKVDA